MLKLWSRPIVSVSRITERCIYSKGNQVFNKSLPRPKLIKTTRSYSQAQNSVQNSEALTRLVARKKKRPGKKSGTAQAAKDVLDSTQPRTPPRGKIVTACCVAQEYDMEHIYRILARQGIQVASPGNILYTEEPEVIHIELPRRFTGDGTFDFSTTEAIVKDDVFIFPSGVVVSWDVDRPNIDHFLKEVLHPAAQGHLGGNAEEETLEYVESVEDDRSLIRGETIVLGTRDTLFANKDSNMNPQSMRLVLEKIAFSAGLARATKLGVLENYVDEYSQSSRAILALLDAGPLSRMKSRRWIYRQLARLLELRAQLNLYTEIADDLPDLLWDTKQELGLEALYNQTGTALGVVSRLRTLNSRLDQLENLLQVLRDMRSETHSSRLEWIIIWLILFEVLHIVWIELYRIPQEKDKVREQVSSITTHG